MFLSKLSIEYYSGPGSLIRVKVLLELSNNATKKELEHVAVIDTAEVEKLDINELVKFSTGLNDSKTKINNLGFIKLKIVPVDFKKKKKK